MIGGGIVGASTALHLAERDCDVTLLDRADPGRATDAGAGTLYTPPFGETDPATLSLVVRANRYFAELLDTLRSTLGDDTDLGFDRRPVLKVGLDESERETVDRARRTAVGYCDSLDRLSEDEVDAVSAEEVADSLPALGPTIGGIRYRRGARLDGRLFTQAMVRAAERAGARSERADARRIRVENGQVDGVVTADGEQFPADAAVVAGGAWSDAFADDLGVDVPVTPQRGQIVHLRFPDRDVGDWPVVSTFRSRYLVPWEDGRIAVGTTHDADAGFDARSTVDGVATLLEAARELIPAAADASFVEARVGLRPRSPDGRPILGPVSDVDGAYVATGHGGGGLHRGPYSGTLIAESVLGRDPEIDLAPFAPARFE